MSSRGDTGAEAGALDIRRTEIGAEPAQRLLAELSADLRVRYPEEAAEISGRHRIESGESDEGKGAFLIAMRGGQPVACGAMRRVDSRTGELKRLFVSAAERRRGLGRRLLEALETEARRIGMTRLVLEAGERQREALALFAGAGYTRIPAYGDHVGSALSVCMEKRLRDG